MLQRGGPLNGPPDVANEWTSTTVDHQDEPATNKTFGETDKLGRTQLSVADKSYIKYTFNVFASLFKPLFGLWVRAGKL